MKSGIGRRLLPLIIFILICAQAAVNAASPVCASVSAGTPDPLQALSSAGMPDPLQALSSAGMPDPLQALSSAGTPDPSDSAAALRGEQTFSEKNLEAKKYPTIYNGVDLSPIYDYSFYMKKYSYLRKRYKNDPAGAILYFGRHGIRKGQIAKKSYSKKTYQALLKKTHPYSAADEILDACNWNLKKAFLYATKIKYYNGSDLGAWGTPWTRTSLWYFNYGLNNKKGNCYVKAGTFVILAREMGKKAVQIGGSVPYHSGGTGPHSWLEIPSGSTTWVYDVSFYTSVYNTQNRGYHFTYGTSGTYRYTNMHKMKVS